MRSLYALLHVQYNVCRRTVNQQSLCAELFTIQCSMFNTYYREVLIRVPQATSLIK
jgi:hypothetical protein